jgi:hypothetical protein
MLKHVYELTYADYVLVLYEIEIGESSIGGISEKALLTLLEKTGKILSEKKRARYE